MTVVLLPGMDGTGRLFDGLRRALRPEVRTEVFAYPTHEVLDYPELLELVAARMPTGPHLVFAESFSGPLGVMYASRQPKNLRGLMLCASFVFRPIPAALGRLAAFATHLVPTAPPSVAVRALMLGADATPARVDAVRHAMQRVDPALLRGRLRAVSAVDVRSELARVRVPVAYLRATRDRLVPASCAREVLSCLPSTRLMEMDAGHLVAQQEPEAVAALVEAFLESTTA